MENIYDEVFEPEYTNIRTEYLEELKETIEKQKDKISELEEDMTYTKERNSKLRKKNKDYEELVKVFLDNANNLLQSDEDTIAKIFEFIKSKGLIENERK